MAYTPNTQVRRAEPMSFAVMWPKIRKVLLTMLIMQFVTGNLNGHIATVKNWLVGETIPLKTDLSDAQVASESDHPSLADVAKKVYESEPIKEKELPPYKPLWWPVSYVEVDLHIDVTGGLNNPSADYRVRLDKPFDITKSLVVTVPGDFNGTLVGNVEVTRLDGGDSFQTSFNLTDYKTRKGQKKLKHLLGGGDEKDYDDSNDKDVILPYYSPNISLAMVYGAEELPFTRMPFSIVQHYIVDHETYGYYPAIFNNKFWTLESQLREINSTEPVDLKFNIELYKQSFFYFQILSGLNDPNNGGPAGGELESVKKVLLDSNPYLLALTAFVSVLHMLFEFLAFKNDISHWKSKKDNTGVSVRSIVANVVMQTIILLYLVDNSEETNYMILFSQGFGILVEAWKVTKVWNKPEEDKTEIEKQTEEYDEIAFKYMYMGAVPLILAYAGYSLKYETHKSWYSFIIATLVGSVYAYGFLMLVPSIYINYRLKSVAHIPRKAMVYKFLNTFIDDLFAFVIKMPWLHRLATLRDDIIFFIYLYQTYLYRVDYRRVNEFGQGGDDDGKSDKPAKKPLTERQELKKAVAEKSKSKAKQH